MHIPSLHIFITALLLTNSVVIVIIFIFHKSTQNYKHKDVEIDTYYINTTASVTHDTIIKCKNNATIMSQGLSMKLHNKFWQNLTQDISARHHRKSCHDWKSRISLPLYPTDTGYTLLQSTITFYHTALFHTQNTAVFNSSSALHPSGIAPT